MPRDGAQQIDSISSLEFDIQNEDIAFSFAQLVERVVLRLRKADQLQAMNIGDICDNEIPDVFRILHQKDSQRLSA